MTVRDDTEQRIQHIFTTESRRVLATLIRLLGDFDLAEDALQEAFIAALRQWPGEGVPDNPRAWLVSAGRFKAIDQLRRRARHDQILHEQAEQLARIVDEMGADVFAFGNGFGQDTITDFDASNDFERIDLTNVTGITGFADLTAGHLRQSGADTLIVDGPNVITLAGVAIADIDAADFIF